MYLFGTRKKLRCQVYRDKRKFDISSLIWDPLWNLYTGL